MHFLTPPVWKLHNPYCHSNQPTTQILWQLTSIKFQLHHINRKYLKIKLTFLFWFHKIDIKSHSRMEHYFFSYLLSLLLVHPTSLWTNFFLLALCCSDKNPFRHLCIELKLYWGQLSQDLRGRPVARLLTQTSLIVIFLTNPNCQNTI